MSMITATTWVPRGFAAHFPTKYDVDEVELARISKLAKLQLDDAKEDLEGARNGNKEDTENEDTSEGDGNGVRLPKSNGYARHASNPRASALADSCA